ncbi:MAG: TetR/AcrR family transcriptional regulator [Dehalococcoidia bacterium]|nr:TetR/AcrR family transcriptional regulator [Dehalococcoidia bacterium]
MARVSDAHLEARRQSILAAATRVFAQKGIVAATMADIASEAGISPGAIYRYFPNKSDLARGCMNESNDSVRKAWANPETIEVSFSELAALTFSEINAPEERIDTQMFLERMLIAVREGDAGVVDEFRDEARRVAEGIAYLMEREFTTAGAGTDLKRLGLALFAFYWGSRLFRFIDPSSEPVELYGELETVLKQAFKQ